MAKADLTAQRLRELLSYNPETGEFVWIVRTSNRTDVGAPAGWVQSRNLCIGINGAQHRVHRLAWLYMTGQWPTGHIDHIDGNWMNNRWENLRDVTPTENWQNRRGPQANNTSGLLGVAWDKAKGKWAAGISIKGKRLNLGRFDDKHEAYAVYLEARRKHYAGNTL